MPLSSAQKLEIAEAYMAASRANDGAALTALCRDDSLTWHNFDELEVSVGHMVKAMGWVHRVVPDATWTTLALTPTTVGFVWQSVLEGTAPGGPLHCHSCVIVTLDDDGKIARIEEYLDTAQTTPLRG